MNLPTLFSSLTKFFSILRFLFVYQAGFKEINNSTELKVLNLKTANLSESAWNVTWWKYKIRRLHLMDFSGYVRKPRMSSFGPPSMGVAI